MRSGTAILYRRDSPGSMAVSVIMRVSCSRALFFAAVRPEKEIYMQKGMQRKYEAVREGKST